MVDVTRLLSLIAEGKTYQEVANELGMAKSTVCWYRKRAGHPVKPFKRYDWCEVQQYHDAGHTRLQTIAQFKMAKCSWDGAVRRGQLIFRRRQLDDMLVDGFKGARCHVKKKLIDQRRLKNECAECGQAPHWMGKRLVMVLDHINGRKHDYRFENLRLLCPNCNSQTDTFSGRNVRNLKAIPGGVTGSMADSDSVDPRSNRGLGTEVVAVV